MVVVDWEEQQLRKQIQDDLESFKERCSRYAQTEEGQMEAEFMRDIEYDEQKEDLEWETGLSWQEWLKEAKEKGTETWKDRREQLQLMPYKEYLETPEWKQRRLLKVKSAGYRCQVCNSDGSLEVHHRTYERRGAERMEDLTVLCHPCHELFSMHGRLVKPLIEYEEVAVYVCVECGLVLRNDVIQFRHCLMCENLLCADCFLERLVCEMCCSQMVA